MRFFLFGLAMLLMVGCATSDEQVNQTQTYQEQVTIEKPPIDVTQNSNLESEPSKATFPRAKKVVYQPSSTGKVWVEGHYRTTKNGKRVWVKGYYRKK